MIKFQALFFMGEEEEGEVTVYDEMEGKDEEEEEED